MQDYEIYHIIRGKFRAPQIFQKSRISCHKYYDTIFYAHKSTFNCSFNFQLLLIKVFTVLIYMHEISTSNFSQCYRFPNYNWYLCPGYWTDHLLSKYLYGLKPTKFLPHKAPCLGFLWWYFTFYIELLKAIKVLYLWKDLIITWYKAVLVKVRRLRSRLAYSVITEVKLYLLIPIHSLIMASL